MRLRDGAQVVNPQREAVLFLDPDFYSPVFLAAFAGVDDGYEERR
jgi:hypothetical protein